ncbi:MAG: hypothetical protein J3R72DRAFT_170056 [Linnemannia gamsii]|nr:MAG: hypothetical protein J3R72DRAFT_170056 [Linnemannia gamsii]
MGACSSCCADRNRSGLYEPLLQENEREAVADLLQYLESKSARYHAQHYNPIHFFVYSSAYSFFSIPPRRTSPAKTTTNNQARIFTGRLVARRAGKLIDCLGSQAERQVQSLLSDGNKTSDRGGLGTNSKEVA